MIVICYKEKSQRLLSLIILIILTISAMTATAASMTEYQYLVMKFTRSAMLLSEKRMSCRVRRGPRGST